jgi:hypothetical protein
MKIRKDENKQDEGSFRRVLAIRHIRGMRRRAKAKANKAKKQARILEKICAPW